MKLKTARRFLNRNKWKITRYILDENYSNNFMKQVRLAKQMLGDIKFRKFNLREEQYGRS